MEQAYENVCEHYYAWCSPKGVREGVRICQLCHFPDPEWIKENVMHHDEETMTKVYAGLQAAGLSDEEVLDAVMQLLNRGVYFRERCPD